MKITQELKKKINSWIRKQGYGLSPFAELGSINAEESITFNHLAVNNPFEDDFDLFDLSMLREIKEIELIDGKAWLDLYIRAREGASGPCELITNVYVTIGENSQLIAISEAIRRGWVKSNDWDDEDAYQDMYGENHDTCTPKELDDDRD